MENFEDFSEENGSKENCQNNKSSESSKYTDFQLKKEFQSEMVPLVVENLRWLNVEPGDQLKLEFFFDAKNKTDAQKLEAYLKTNFDYELYGIHEFKGLWSVNGCTGSQPILTEFIQKWSEQMCEVAYQFNCEFDGWGTSPDLK